jgi:hypothetical protein
MADSGEDHRSADGGNKIREAIAALLGAANRGLLLDIAVFVANLTLFALLAEPFLGLIRSAASDDAGAAKVLLAIAAALFVLPPIGATLKRWHFHQRLSEQAGRELESPAGSCLFNPIMYFCLVVVIFAAINAAVLQTVYQRTEPPGAIFVSSIFIGLILIGAHTFLVYRFFSPPKAPPRSAFLRSPVSEVLGDACLFANMLFYQLLWNAMSFAGVSPPSGTGEVIGRTLVLLFLALLLYFPPRMFYLALDAGKARTWIMILIANSPLIARLVFGVGSDRGW